MHCIGVTCHYKANYSPPSTSPEKQALQKQDLGSGGKVLFGVLLCSSLHVLHSVVPSAPWTTCNPKLGYQMLPTSCRSSTKVSARLHHVGPAVLPESVRQVSRLFLRDVGANIRFKSGALALGGSENMIALSFFRVANSSLHLRPV